MLRLIHGVAGLGGFFEEKVLCPPRRHKMMNEPHHSGYCAEGYWQMRWMLRRYSFQSVYVEDQGARDFEQRESCGCILWRETEEVD